MTQMNCPNCGAPLKGHICEYCGTSFVDEGETFELRLYADELMARKIYLEVQQAQMRQSMHIRDSIMSTLSEISRSGILSSNELRKITEIEEAIKC